MMQDALLAVLIDLEDIQRRVGTLRHQVGALIANYASLPSTSSAVSRGHVRSVVEDLSPAPPTHTGMMCFDVASTEDES